MEYDEENLEDYKLPQFKSFLFRFLAKYFPWPLRLIIRHNRKIDLGFIDKAKKFISKDKSEPDGS